MVGAVPNAAFGVGCDEVAPQMARVMHVDDKNGTCSHCIVVYRIGMFAMVSRCVQPHCAILIINHDGPSWSWQAGASTDGTPSIASVFFKLTHLMMTSKAEQVAI